MTVPPVVSPPPGNSRFALFDTLRALAALSVLVFHAAVGSQADQFSGAGPLLGRLNIGVTIFFLISGFLLYRPYVAAEMGDAPRPGLSHYARSRVLRIVPAYWVALTLLAVYPGLPGVFSGDWWIYYGFAQVYSPNTILLGIGPAGRSAPRSPSMSSCPCSRRSCTGFMPGAAAAGGLHSS